jgi:hypothetical protein
MIISVHLPKTAGTSFAAALERRYGAALLRDYADLPLNTRPRERNRSAVRNCLANADNAFAGVECIHGHFLPLKYLLLADGRPDVSFVTWLRNPIDRAVSHYRFWRKTYDPERAPPLHRTMMQEGWSLERFCLGIEVRDLYSQFLYGFPLEYFSFVGITEFYAQDFSWWATRFLGDAGPPDRLNVADSNPDRDEISPALRTAIEGHHARDMELYGRALAWRRERAAG